MQITFSSILMAVFWSGILSGMIYAVRKTCRYIKSFGIGCIVLVYLFCMARVVVPIDFSFTKGIHLKGVFSDICDFLNIKKYYIGNYGLTMTNIFMVVWLLGVVFLLIRFAREYRSMCKALKHLTVREDAQCSDILQEVFAVKGKKKKVTVLKSKEIPVPMGIGILNKKILLPDQEYKDDKLYYILLHEYTHFLNGDLLIKVLVHIFCCIFWWNPIAYFLSRDLDRSLEVKCDLCITETLSMKEMAEYLQTIVMTLQASGKKKKFLSIDDAVALGRGKKDEIVERFEYVQKNQANKGRSGRKTLVWLALFCIVWVASYSFVPLPSFDPDIRDIETGPGIYEITPQKGYVLYDAGNYYWIVEGESDNIISESYANQLENSGFEVRRK